MKKAKMLLEQKKAQEKKNLPSKQQFKEDDQQEQEEQILTHKKNVFAFNDFGEDDSSEEEPAEQKQEKTIQEEPTTEKKKNKKKKKKKMTEEQKLEQALKELGMGKKKEQAKNSKEEEQQAAEWQRILDIKQAKFNYQKQLRRHFRDWEQEKPDKKDPQVDKRYQRMQKHLQKSMKKSVLSPGIKEFFPIRERFEITHEESKQSKNTQLRFVPTKKYQHYQVEYDALKNSNDINALFMFTQTHPQHVDSIYSVGQFLRLQGNYRDADAMIQRVIYIYEIAGSYDLSLFLNKEGRIKQEIVYDTYSTSLFMSVFKFMEILGKKGCFRAALQYNKFLLKINLNDPSACLLCLDYNAISSKQFEYLTGFILDYSRYIEEPQTSLYLMPNFIYSYALAKFHIENTPKKLEQGNQLVLEENNMTEMLAFSEEDWQQALKLPNKNSFSKQNCRVLILRAIMVYPKLMLDIADKNQYKKQFLNHPKFQGNQKKGFKANLEDDFWKMVPDSYSYHFLKLQSEHDSKGLDKVLEVYVERSKILWKSNEVMLWMKGAIGFILNQLQSNFDYQSYLQQLCTQECGGVPIPFSLSRYQNISKANFSDRVDIVDLNNIQDNQQMQIQEQHNANPINLEGNGFSLFLNSLLPWVNLPGSGGQGENGGNFDPNMPFIEEDD